MSLISDIFQQNQQMAQKPTQVIRTPQQVAYDNLLNKQYDIEQQNKNYNLYNGLASGIGGLGKILASTFVKNPYQQAGAMQGISEQEQRLDNLRQAYENARQSQNKDYVQQAKDQLDMARADEDKQYNRDLTAQQMAYQKALDAQKQENFEKQQAFDNDVRIQQLDMQRQKINAELQAMADQNSPEAKDLKKRLQEADIALKEAQANKIKYENSEEYRNQANQQEEEKERDKKNTENIKLADTYAGREEITPELNAAIKNNPKLGDYFISSGKYNNGSYVGNLANAATGGIAGKVFGIGKNTNKYTLDFAQIIRDMTGKEPTKKDIAQLKKDLGLKDD